MGRWKIRCPSVMQKSAANGSQGIGVSVGVGGMGVGLKAGDGVFVFVGAEVGIDEPGRVAELTGTTAGRLQEMRKTENNKTRIFFITSSIVHQERFHIKFMPGG